MKLYTISFVLSVCACAQSANILAFFPLPAKSHHAVFQQIVMGLANKGHQVTYFTLNPVSKPPATLKQISFSHNILEQMGQMRDEDSKRTDIGMKIYNWLSDNWCNFLVRTVAGMTEIILNDKNVQELIHDTKSKYDLILLETTFAQEVYATFAHKFGAHLVEVMPTSNFHWTYYLHGIPYDTNYIVDLDVSYTDHMTFVERLINTCFSMATRIYNTYYSVPQLQALADKYIRYPGWESRPPLLDIVKNTSLFLMNTHEAVNYPHPIPPNVKLIGGINIQQKTKPLPKDVQEFMDGAKDGVIYFTLGSHINASTTLGDKLREEFVKAFGKIKQKVLWKWESQFPTSSNVKIGQWFPQQDILAHPNMKLFITHGGLLSMTEAMHYGVPLIGIPILGDQPKNVNHIQTVGYGLQLYLNNVTDTSISWAINEIISNPRYRETIKERSLLLKDREHTPLETALFWIEYVLRHNGAHHLKPSVTSMPWCQRALVDVYLTLAAIIILPILTCYYTIKAVCKCIFCRKSSSKPKKASGKKKNE